MGNQESGAKATPAKAVSGVVFLCLFSLPFAGFGMFALCKSIQFFLTPGKVKEGLMLGLFALVFSVVGYGMFFGAIAEYRAQLRKAQSRATHPDEPWLWRPDWANNRSCSSARGLMWSAWIFALLWNCISDSGAVFMLKSQESIFPKVVFGIIFPLIGLALFGRAVRLTILWKRFGASTFKMLSVPGVIGGSLSGAIETSVKLRPRDGFHLRLACVSRVRISAGKSSTTQETVLWQVEKTMNDDLLGEPRRSGIPVSFQIPADVLPTNDTALSNAIVWRLIAKAKLPGISYSATFEVPVFRTGASTPVLSNGH